MPTTAAPADPVLGVESGFSSGRSSRGRLDATAAAVITNPSTDVAACGVEVTFDFLNAAGAALDTQVVDLAWVPRSGRALVSPEFTVFDLPEDLSSVAVTTVVTDFVATDDLTGCGTPTLDGGFGPGDSGTRLAVLTTDLEVTSIGPVVTGQVNNPTAALVERSTLVCVLRSGGAIVGGSSSEVQHPMYPDQTVAYYASPKVLVPVDAVECEVVAGINETTVGPSDPVLAVESNFSTEVSPRDGTFLSSAGAVVTNPSAEVAACDIKVTFSLQDAAGTVIDTVTDRPSWIPKAGRAIVAPTGLGFYTQLEPTTLTVTTVVHSFVATDDFAGCGTFGDSGTLLQVVDAAPQQVTSYSVAVVGQVANTAGVVVDSFNLSCIVRAGGVIVGGASTMKPDPDAPQLQPGDTVAFETPSVSPAPGADSAECEAEARL